MNTTTVLRRLSSVVCLLSSALCLPAAAQSAYPSLPDPQLTPGVACPGIAAKDLVAGYASKVRAHGTPDGKQITQAVKEAVYREYGIAHRAPGEFEIDHLISLELGGSNDIRNLWPQPYHGMWNAHQKDALENEIHRRVVAGQLDLATAQRAISADWIALYRKVFPDRLNADGSPRPVGPQPNAEPDK